MVNRNSRSRETVNWLHVTSLELCKGQINTSGGNFGSRGIDNCIGIYTKDNEGNIQMFY